MSPAWIPVVITALIVLGVVGGSIAQMVLKEILPLLRSMAQERQAVGGAAGGSAGGSVGGRPGMPPPHEALESIEQRLAQLEAGQQRLEEESDFLQKLLTEGGERKRETRPPQE